MATCFPMSHGHLRCILGRSCSRQSRLCSSFTGSQSPVCWTRQQSSKICLGHFAFGFFWTQFHLSRSYHAYPTALNSCTAILGDNIKECPFMALFLVHHHPPHCNFMLCDLGEAQFPRQRNKGVGALRCMCMSYLIQRTGEQKRAGNSCPTFPIYQTPAECLRVPGAVLSPSLLFGCFVKNTVSWPGPETHRPQGDAEKAGSIAETQP